MPQAVRTERRRGQPATSRKDDVIQIRASADTKAILNHAASLRGQKLSEFMLDWPDDKPRRPSSISASSSLNPRRMSGFWRCSMRRPAPVMSYARC